VLRKQCALCVEKEERKEAPDHLPCCKVDRAIREDPKSYVVRVEVGSKVPMFDEVYVRNPNLEHYVIRDAPPIFMTIGNLVYFRVLNHNHFWGKSRFDTHLVTKP
jgi:hypothetical protein